MALVIGNSAYQGDLPALPNPANDAKLMSKTLKSVGFDVIEAENASQMQMKKAIAAFGDKLAAAGPTATGLFFYAGHGLQVSGENYLIPVDAQIAKEADVDLAAVSTTSVMKQMDFAGSAVNIVILDACRNNPLSNGSRGMSRGLAEITARPRGSFVAYSTAPGSVAQDGDGADSPYTTALAATLTKPGLSIGDVFQEVRSKVLAATGQQQTTWDSSSLTGQFYFTPATATASATPDAAPAQPAVPASVQPKADNAAVDELATEKSYWDSVKDSNDPEEVQLYLNKYPKGYFVDLANARLQELQKTQTASVTPTPAPAPSTGIQHDTQQPPAPAPEVAIIALNQTVYATGDGRMRAAPDGRASLITSFPPNAELTATGRTSDGKWWRIALASGQVGYMHRSVVSEQPVQTAAAPQQAQPAVVAPADNAMSDPNAVVMIDGGQPAQSNAGSNAVTAQQAQQLANAAQNPQAMGNQALNGFITGLSQLVAGSGQQMPTPNTDTRMQFAAYNHPVTVRPGAVVLNSPGNGQPIAQVSRLTQLTASARTSDGAWYAVVLPNGNTGYLAANWVQR
ncbi:MAG TPA: caspase family protein [Dongiaceae bacterium]|nr:caspase family protein [Dongiaceae bacterium]